MEGLSHEAISLAGHLRLNRLIVLFDDNEISIDGATSLSCSDDQLARFKASGWSACRIDGHDPEAIAAAIETGPQQRPAVADRLPHGDRLRRAEPSGQRKSAWRAARRRGGRKDPRCAELAARSRSRFRQTVLAQWRKAGARGHAARRSWIERTQASQFRRAVAVPRCAQPESAVRLCRRDGAACATRFGAERPNIATRQASQLVIDGIAEALPNLLGGSADLTHSNLTRAKTQQPVRPGSLRRQLHPLRRPRARHGGGDERHRAAWRLHPLWRHVPHLRRLQPPRDQAGGADGHPRHPCDDARFHRTGRGWPHPSAGRASGIAAGDPQSAGVPARRCRRDRGSLGLRAAGARQPVGAVPVAAGDADVPRSRRRAESGRVRRLRRGRAGGAAATSR